MIDGHLTVTDVEIFEQETSGAHSTITIEALAKFQDEVVRAGGSMKDYTLWWHSHAHMSVFFSKTDTDTIDGSTEFPYLVSLVVNKKAEFKARLDVHYPTHLTCDNVDVEIGMYDDPEVNAIQEMLRELIGKRNDEIKTLCQSEIDKKLKKTEYTPPKYPVTNFWEKDKMEERQGKIHYPTSWEYTQDEVDYWNHKIFLKNQILHLEKRTDKKGKEILEKRLEEIEEHIIFGRSQGYEIAKFEESTTKDS
jgi:hypothetical protein